MHSQPESPMEQNSSPTMNRREAIKRTAMLLGVAVSSSTIAGCLGEDRGKLGAGANWKPLYLNKTQARLVSTASELIFPRTDTPGAQDVGVPQWIDVLYGKYMSPGNKAVFTKGLADLDSTGFQEKSNAGQIKAMQNLGKSDREFIQILRDLTFTGYFTSEEVCKNVTTYDPVPGAYHGCVPISVTGNVVMSEVR